MNVREELARLAQLKADGILTEAEFEQQKAALLARSAMSPMAAPPTVQATTPPQKGGALKGCLILFGLLAWSSSSAQL